MFSDENHCCLGNVYRLSTKDNASLNLFMAHPFDWKKNQQMVSNVFVVDQSAQTHFYLIIYVCVGITEADARGYT